MKNFSQESGFELIWVISDILHEFFDVDLKELLWFILFESKQNIKTNMLFLRLRVNILK